MTLGAVTGSGMLSGGALARLLRGGGGVVVSGSLMGLLAGVATGEGEFGSGNSNISTAARPFLRGWRLFASPILVVLVVLGFLGLTADWGLDKKSCALNSSEVGAGELDLLLLLRLGCGEKVAVSDVEISELLFGGWGGRRRLDLPDSLEAPD